MPSNTMRRITDFMTRCPYTVSADASLDEAIKAMELHHIRHLPVARDGELVGVLTEHEARLVRALSEMTPFNPKVGEVCEKDPYIVASDALISPVALEMAERQIECVLVADEDENVVGIFTTSDACRYIHYLTSDK